MHEQSTSGMTRRQFMGSAAVGAAAFTFVPGRVLGTGGAPSANHKLNIAGVGIGGIGKINIEAVAATENIVALCDVDWDLAKTVFAQYPKARPFKDY